MRRIILYTKPGCHLCDDAYEVLRALGNEASEQLDIIKVNILEDPELHARYRHAIPVISVDPDKGGPILYAPIVAPVLRHALGLDKDCVKS